VNEIKCKIEGCSNVFRTNEPVSPEARFICKDHPRNVQLAAVGRTYNEKWDNEDAEVHFQEHAFDPKLTRRPDSPADSADPHHVE